MKNYLFKSRIDIDFKSITAGDTLVHTPEENNLNVVIMNGTKGATVRIGSGETIILSPHTLFLTGKDSKVNIILPEDGRAIALYFDYVGKYCDSKICTYLEKTSQTFSNAFSILPMNEALKGYFIVMDTSMVENFDEIPFREIKYKEFFFLLCKWLEISDFAEFLHPAMSWYDPVFRRKVMDNYTRSYRVKTLASDCGYSEKGFVKKFRNEFGVTPHKWINDQIHQVIVKKLANPSISMNEIAADLQMSSAQSFSRFCRRAFGLPPSKLRKELVK